MSEAHPEKTILAWWGQRLDVSKNNTGAARTLRARLRRAAGPVDVLAHAEVVELGQKLNLINDPKRLVVLASLLPWIKSHRPGDRLAKILGKGDPPVLSNLRFQRLVHSTDIDDLKMPLIRALALADNACDISRLGCDLLFWGDKVRSRWCFEYFGSTAPAILSESTTETAEIGADEETVP